jgi:fic family toxin-antitoxin system
MTVYLTEKQIEKINALVIQRYSANEQIQTVSPSALNMIVGKKRLICA